VIQRHSGAKNFLATNVPILIRYLPGKDWKKMLRKRWLKILH